MCLTFSLGSYFVETTRHVLFRDNQSCTGFFQRVLPVLPTLTGFYWVLSDLTAFSCDLLGFTEFYWFFTEFFRFYHCLRGFTGFFWIFLLYTGFY